MHLLESAQAAWDCVQAVIPLQLCSAAAPSYAAVRHMLLTAAWCTGECSNAVAAMVALISPLPYSADFRPYFTIHDPAFAALAAGELPSAANGHPRLLGITNLYFLKVSLALSCHPRPTARHERTAWPPTLSWH